MLKFSFYLGDVNLIITFRFSEEQKDKFMRGYTLRQQWWNDSQGLTKSPWTKEEAEAVSFYDRLMELAINKAQKK